MAHKTNCVLAQKPMWFDPIVRSHFFAIYTQELPPQFVFCHFLFFFPIIGINPETLSQNPIWNQEFFLLLFQFCLMSILESYSWVDVHCCLFWMFHCSFAMSACQNAPCNLFCFSFIRATTQESPSLRAKKESQFDGCHCVLFFSNDFFHHHQRCTFCFFVRKRQYG